MIVKQIAVGDMENFSYILVDESTKKAAIIDPAWEPDKLLSELDGCELVYIINTHTHYDHVNGNDAVKEATGAEIVDTSQESIMLGETELKFLSTPGHRPEAVCILADGKLFTGDTLFVNGSGRTDLEGGNTEDLYKSLEFLKTLPDETEVYPGHDYGDVKISTIGREKENNPHLRCSSQEDFIQLREGR